MSIPRVKQAALAAIQKAASKPEEVTVTYSRKRRCLYLETTHRLTGKPVALRMDLLPATEEALRKAGSDLSKLEEELFIPRLTKALKELDRRAFKQTQQNHRPIKLQRRHLEE